ncbi:MAG TPA: YqgE/AlgH family protein, partial [Ramlibacter sp.]|nr:YqgE/AlgH family protein [Ramlibacter sp.]
MPADDSAINLTHHFLIAMPGLEDEAFARSVVYLCEHSARGALGLVINKPSDINLKNLFDKVDLPLRREDLAGTPVFQGGPVQTER